jgi:hypothetical protein
MVDIAAPLIALSRTPTISAAKSRVMIAESAVGSAHG